MPTITDARFDALRAQGFTGATNDLLLQWLKANGATSNALPDAWKEMLEAQGYTYGSRNDSWYALLGDLGYTGALNDRELAFWSDGGTLSNGYTFNGVDQYAIHAAWSSLGNPAVYASFSFTTNNPDGNIVNPTQPITEFGRNGANYHDGSLSNLRYIDSSPIQGTSVKTGAVGTLPDIPLNEADITFDYIVSASSEDILDGLVSIAGGVLSFDAGVVNPVVDGSGYAGAVIPTGRHIRVGFYADTGGALSTINAASGMQNLAIETTIYD